MAGVPGAIIDNFKLQRGQMRCQNGPKPLGAAAGVARDFAHTTS
jgi:hypothetical protein